MKIPGQFPNKVTLQDQANIIRVSGNGNYSNLHFSDGRVLMACYTLHYFNVFLPHFVRTHKQHLVNPAFVQSVDKDKLVVRLDKAIVPVSRRRIKDVVEGLQKSLS